MAMSEKVSLRLFLIQMGILIKFHVMLENTF